MAEADCVVSEECIKELLELFSKGNFKAKNVDKRNEIIHKTCIHLIARDYEVEVIDNKSGQLCGHYPSELIVIEAHKSQAGHSCCRVNDTAQLKELILTARYARCRSRFVMPVILFEDKNICRSATLSTMAEIYGRVGMDWITGTLMHLCTGEERLGSVGQRDRGSVPLTDLTQNSGAVSGATCVVSGGGHSSTDSEETELMKRVKGQDVQLLKVVGVELICDLMVETKKIRYGLVVSSSEKEDKSARYKDFQIATMPYPGCEFFRDYKDKGFDPVNLHFNWSQPMINADLLIPEPLQQLTQIQFKAYQDWDLVQITSNYLKLLLTYILNGKGSLLVHCISGWDRTPLFISLLRLSLWADNRAHCSLSPKEILYFTIAYDWFTFGHHFKKRHEKGEEVMFFCFDFLKYMTSDELSVNSLNRTKVAENHSSHTSHPPSLPTSSRQDKLLAVRTLYQRAYRAAVPEVQPSGCCGLFNRFTR